MFYLRFKIVINTKYFSDGNDDVHSYSIIHLLLLSIVSKQRQRLFIIYILHKWYV